MDRALFTESERERVVYFQLPRLFFLTQQPEKKAIYAALSASVVSYSVGEEPKMNPTSVRGEGFV